MTPSRPEPGDKWDCADGTPEEDHDWQFRSDWWGDPCVINGTVTFYMKVCRVCGKEEPASAQEFYDYHADDGYY